MSEIQNNITHQEQNEAIKKKSYILACSEGEERSVFAAEIFKSLGFQYIKILPGGLEGLRSYLNNQSSIAKTERLYNRGIKNAFVTSALKERQNETEYKKLLRRNATWLLFIDKTSEAKYFKETISELRYFGLAVLILHSWDEDSVTEEINKFIKINK